MKIKIVVLWTALVIFSLSMSACGQGEAVPTPGLSMDTIQTVAVATFSNSLTQTAFVAPTSTPLPTMTPALMFSTPTFSIPALATSTGGSNPGACYSLIYISDVTIPDGTPMTPGQTFTKTWKVRNTGTCAWDPGFQFRPISGDSMGGTNFILSQSVPANTQMDISVKMTAPDKKGSVRGDWQMATAGGQLFGNKLYVEILVGTATGTATNTSVPATSTSTSTPTEETPSS